jgi:hypothetical protein
MDGASVMRCYISTDIALTACLRQRLTLLGRNRPVYTVLTHLVSK